MTTPRILTAPSIVKALRYLGVNNQRDLNAIPRKELIGKLKAMGANNYTRGYILRRLYQSEGRYYGEFTVGKLEGEYTANDVQRISLRDHFAAKAMQGQFAALWSGELEEPSMCVLGDSTAASVAESAYRMADAMLKAREQ